MERIVIDILSFVQRLFQPIRLFSVKLYLRPYFATNSCTFQYSWVFQRYVVITVESPQRSEDLQRIARPDDRRGTPKEIMNNEQRILNS